ncbi:MAG: vitamin K epoxide reductase family protein [Candidatus Heimdallarchaeaceae archaeon]
MPKNNPELALRTLNLSLIFSLIGLIDALYLLYSELTGSIYCVIEGGVFNCKDVNTSTYAKFLGLHVSFWGSLFYLSVIVTTILAQRRKNQNYWLSFFLPVMVLWGAIFSIYLTIIEAVVIKAFCEFCLLSAICTFTLVPIVLFSKKFYFGGLFKKLDFRNMFKKEAEG